MMASGGLFTGLIPYGIFMGLATVMQVAPTDITLFSIFVLTTLVATYLLCFGAFALIQKSNCGKVNMGQAASNAGLATAAQAVVLLITYFVSWFRDMVTGLMPPDIDPAIQLSVGYGFWTFWASVYGIAVGGTLSGVCQ